MPTNPLPTNPWLASGSTASPTLRARDLRRIWDDYFGAGRLERVRKPIAESWHRSDVAGFDPSRSRAPTIANRRDSGDRWEAHPLAAAAPLIRRWLGPVANDGDHVIVVSDAEGVLLWLDGDVRLRSAAAEAMNFVEGALWSETGAGTNAIGTALVADHALQVHAAEHFSEVVHGWTCSAAPVHDPEDGRLLGIIDLTALMTKAHPQSLAAVLAAARAVEADLRVRAQIRDAQLRLRYLERTASTSDSIVLVSRSGRVIADHPDGLVRRQRLEVPTNGGAVTLPNGRAGFAEVLERENAYIVRPVPGRHRGSLSRQERTERAAPHWKWRIPAATPANGVGRSCS